MARKSTPDKMLGEWFWTDRWMGSSGFLLPLEPRGLYREMLTQAWRRGARLPNDHETIQRAVGCTAAEWKRCWPKVERHWRVDGDHLVNDTQLEVYAECLAEREKASNRGKKGAQARAQAVAQARAQACARAPSQADGEHVLEDKPPDPDPEGELSERQESSRRTRARVFAGERLKVSQAQHQVVLDELGPLARHLDLPALYASWDAQLTASRESFDTLVFIKRGAAEALRALRACGLTRVRDATEAQAVAARETELERSREQERELVDELWLLVGEDGRRELRELAMLEVKAFLVRMLPEQRAVTVDFSARRILGERFPGCDRKQAELERLRASAAVA